MLQSVSNAMYEALRIASGEFVPKPEPQDEYMSPKPRARRAAVIDESPAASLTTRTPSESPFSKPVKHLGSIPKHNFHYTLQWFLHYEDNVPVETLMLRNILRFCYFTVGLCKSTNIENFSSSGQYEAPFYTITESALSLLIAEYLRIPDIVIHSLLPQVRIHFRHSDAKYLLTDSSSFIFKQLQSGSFGDCPQDLDESVFLSKERKQQNRRPSAVPERKLVRF
ncbi:hypothetical protein GEMRC1_007233 [Eukaryota sp. GEM-RC1]